jgi:hypothetical protein
MKPIGTNKVQKVGKVEYEVVCRADIYKYMVDKFMEKRQKALKESQGL